MNLIARVAATALITFPLTVVAATGTTAAPAAPAAPAATTAPAATVNPANAKGVATKKAADTKTDAKKMAMPITDMNDMMEPTDSMQ